MFNMYNAYNISRDPLGGYGALLARLTLATLALAVALCSTPVVRADDTEIFRAVYTAGSGRPKVLILFDDSGSMDTLVDVPKPAYDPGTSYPAVTGIQSGRLYWQSGTSGNPPPANTGQWFNQSRNRCASSYGPLASQGYFINALGRWNSASSTSWASLSTSSTDPLHVDCSDDVSGSNTGNGTGTGSPGTGYPRSSTPRPYGASKDANVSSGWTTYRVYTANYMNWYYSATLGVDRSRIDIAKDTIASIVDANPGIDFGLGVFNSNYDTDRNGNPVNNGSSSHDGGRIVKRIIEDMSASQRSNLLSVLDSFEAEGSTPLCETVYEAYRYLAGKTVLYGLERASGDTPSRDSGAESGGKYVSPVGECQNVYIILMTDGEPQLDTDANSAIETLTRKTCKNYTIAKLSQSDPSTQKNCLPELAEYMNTTDLDGNASNGTQKAILYTIGFTVNQVLLSDAATKGGGIYYTTNTAEGLADAFQGAITAIRSTATTFTAPSIAVDTFTRTESRNEVFFAMFAPQSGADWPGNIKKLAISITNGVATLVDADGNAAIDASTGKILDSARTYWSAGSDGSKVKAGGVGALLAARDPDTRVIKTNTGASGALQDFNSTNITAAAYGLAGLTQLLDLFGVSSQNELNDLLAWARGFTDRTKTDTREWILGDMLHSRPLVLNYGARGTHTATDPDVRIVVGTNAGFLHMFDNGNGAENWAFFPKELAPVLEQRRANAANNQNVYGIDAPVAYYSKDLNKDGTIDSTAGDKLYIFFGLRRGGKAFYALDVSNPDSPAFLWKIDKGSSGFEELGQSWSVPAVTYVPGYASSGVPKPVLIFGAGYDTAKDSKNTVAGADGEGRGVFIVDAQTGAKVWSVTPADNGTRNLQATGLQYSMPADVTVLDSNGDGLTDRIYAPDTGGNVWRVDLPGNALPGASQTTWRITKLAALNTSATDGHAGDRRFFSATDVVRARDSTLGIFDAVMIGSGDRENPNATDNVDRLYMLRDRQTGVYATVAPTPQECTDGSTDHRCVLPITNADLYDATLNLIQDGTSTERAAAQIALAGKEGWYIDLTAATGEKALARSLTIAGKVYFTTYSPPGETSVSQCEPPAGAGRLYVLNMLNATAANDFNGDDALARSDRLVQLGSLIPDTPAPHFGSDKKIRLLFPSGGSIQGQVNPYDTGARLRQPYGTYWYDQEY